MQKCNGVSKLLLIISYDGQNADIVLINYKSPIQVPHATCNNVP
jgi:hypothetical protein